MDRCKIPDRADAALHHQVGDCLRHARRRRDHAQTDVRPAQNPGQFVEVVHLLAVNRLPDFQGISVESCNNIDAVVLKALIPQQRASQASGTCENPIFWWFQPRKCSIRRSRSATG